MEDRTTEDLLRQREGPEDDQPRPDQSEGRYVRPIHPERSRNPGLRTLVESVGVVAAPATVVSALAYYIGVVRQEELVRHFGLDLSLLEFSTQDYVLRSVDALIRFIVAVCLLAVVLVGAHLLVASRFQPRSGPARNFFAWGVAGCGAAGAAVGMWRLARPVPLRGLYLLGPVALGLGAILIAYAGLQLTRYRVLPRWLPAVAAGTVGVLALAAVFWAASDYARVQGRSRALGLEHALTALPAAVLYSDVRLHLGASGIQEDLLGEEGGKPLYRYRGLRLLIRSGGKYFLLPSGWTRKEGTVVVLPDNDSLRFEFRPGGGS